MKKFTVVFFVIYFAVNSLHLSAYQINNNKGGEKTYGYAAYSTTEELKPYNFYRRKLKENDVGIDIAYCGICHSDLHTVKGEWGDIKMPLVPGHEIVGIVSAVGSQVSEYKVGDKVGVGCLIDSCQDCLACDVDHENYCNHKVFAYGTVDKESGSITQGGYSNYIVVTEDFVVRIPDNLELASAAPLLCAGITNYSVLSHWDVGVDDVIAVVGIGGLGHLAIKIAKALGAEVVAFTHSPDKVEDAKKLGADGVVVIDENSNIIETYKEKFDLILDTTPASHDVNMYLECLKGDATLVFVGIPAKEVSIDIRSLISKRRNISGSMIGGITETERMLKFCAKHNITADVEVITADEINKAYERMLKSDVKYRFVIDASTFYDANKNTNKIKIENDSDVEVYVEHVDDADDETSTGDIANDNDTGDDTDEADMEVYAEHADDADDVASVDDETDDDTDEADMEVYVEHADDVDVAV